MSKVEIIFLLIGIFFGGPILAYLIAKFATAGILRAKGRNKNKE